MSAGANQPQALSGVVYYIDASYFIFRAYHSMPPDMVDGDGNATHALYGFARFLSDLLERVRPERIGEPSRLICCIPVGSLFKPAAVRSS